MWRRPAGSPGSDRSASWCPPSWAPPGTSSSWSTRNGTPMLRRSTSRLRCTRRNRCGRCREQRRPHRASESRCCDAGGPWRARIEQRLAVVATSEGCEWSEPQWGLNEVMVEKRARHRLVRLAVYLEGAYVTTFSGDGVIVATPTGSTAYSFSARGPIVSPALACLLLTPVSPHMVFDRAMVLSPSEDLTLEVQGEEPGLLSADGRAGLELPVGARVRVR